VHYRTDEGRLFGIRWALQKFVHSPAKKRGIASLRGGLTHARRNEPVKSHRISVCLYRRHNGQHMQHNPAFPNFDLRQMLAYDIQEKLRDEALK